MSYLKLLTFLCNSARIGTSFKNKLPKRQKWRQKNEKDTFKGILHASLRSDARTLLRILWG